MKKIPYNRMVGTADQHKYVMFKWNPYANDYVSAYAKINSLNGGSPQWTEAKHTWRYNPISKITRACLYCILYDYRSRKLSHDDHSTNA